MGGFGLYVNINVTNAVMIMINIVIKKIPIFVFKLPLPKNNIKTIIRKIVVQTINVIFSFLFIINKKIFYHFNNCNPEDVMLMDCIVGDETIYTNVDDVVVGTNDNC